MMIAKFVFGCILADSKNTFGKLLQKYYNTVAAAILYILNIANDTATLFMAALRSRCGADIIFLPCGFFLSFFFPRLISAAADWMSTVLLHMVCP